MIGDAPVTQPIEDEFGIAKVWRSWLSEVGDALVGEWNFGSGSSGWTLSASGVTTAVTPTVTFQERGRVVDIQVVWDGAVTFSGATLTLPSVGFSLQPGVLSFFETDSSGATATAQDGAYVSDTTITVPDLASATGALITGTVFKEVQ